MIIFIYNIFENKLSVAPFIWIDYGSTQNKDNALPDQTASTYGIGIRGNALFNTTFEAGFGYPLSNTFNSNNVGLDNGIVYFTGGWRF